MALYNQFFFHDMIRKYIVSFGSIFDDIQVVRFNPDCTENSRERVPIQYSQKEKFVVRTEEDPALQRNVAIKLPRMGYELTDFSYDPSRKLATTNYTTNATPNSNVNSKEYAPVPYNFSFSLYIMTKNQVDGYMILEQIVPFFTPDWIITINAIPEMCIQTNAPITLNSVTREDTFEGTFDERRQIVWTLSFTLAGYFFAPVFNRGVIKQVFSNIGIIDETALPVSLNVQEVLEGQPILNGVPLDQIKATDPWTYQSTLSGNQ